MEKTVSRRSLAAAAGLALAGLAGCSPGEAREGGKGDPAWAGGYLPVGSTVRLQGMPEGFEHVVVARRPSHSAAAGVHDYALVQAVLGITSDLAAGGLYAGELVLADEADIAEVVDPGRVTDEEARAEELLGAGRGSGETAADLLVPLIEARKERLGGEYAGR